MLWTVAVQAVAAVYFIVDGLEDALAQFRNGITVDLAMECLVAIALLMAVISGARHLAKVLADAKKQDVALLAARGAMAELVSLRFGEWKLSASEADVARFALKGCTVGEIAAMRASAEGTVRSQLSAVYAKAGVTSQPMLIALFVDELL